MGVLISCLGAENRNKAINGFWAKAGHDGTHTNKFFLALGEAFSNVNNPKQAEAVMNSMLERVQSGEFKKK